ncbi:MAG: glycosyltransferase [Thermoplasmatales archaeon]|nr:glycosyltransferase [Thermoplasmatales archaeon]
MKISVIIYTYDRKDFILEAIKSVLNQTISRDQYEIIVVKGFEDPQIDKDITAAVDACLTVKVKGHGKKIVSALERSTGEIICLLDDDDLFLEGKLKRIKQIFESENDTLFVHNSIIRADEKGDEIPSSPEPRYDDLIFDTRRPDKRVLSRLISKRSNWYGSCMSFRRDVLMDAKEALIGIDQSIDPILFVLTMRKEGKMVKISDRLTKYRTHVSTTNYSLGYSDYVNRRKEFYQNTLRNYVSVIDVCKGTSGESLLNAYISHMKLILDFMNASSRRLLLKDSILLIASLQRVFIGYYLIWVFYSLISIIDQRIGLRVFYILQTSARQAAIERRS